MFKTSHHLPILPITLFSGLMAWMVGAAPVNDDAPQQIERLSNELADEQYSVREKATEELWKLGTSALPKLKELTRSRDPEQAIRARELVRKIELGLFPDSDPELLAIISRYPDAMPSEKGTMIRELQSRKAWRQMLKLHQEETNPNLRDQYESTMMRIAVYAAREKLAKGENAEALELLTLAPQNPESLLATAHYHRAVGTLAEELKKTEGQPGADAAAWRLALHRAAGNMRDALAETDVVNEPELAAAIAAFNGDPVAWLQMRSMEPEDKDMHRDSYEAVGLYARLAMDRWKGNQMDPTDLGKLRKMQENRSSQYRRVARTGLFMLGENRAAEETLVKDSPIMAAQYFLMLERVDEALKLLGHTVEQPCTEDWVRTQLQNIDEDALQDFDQSERVQALYLMAGFLESRGLDDLAFECFHKPVLEFAEREKQVFLNFLMRLFNESESSLTAPKLAIRLSAAWAQEKDDRWGSLTDTFWAGDDDSHDWWKLLGEISADSSRAERLELVQVLSRRLPGQDGQRNKWIDLIWKHYQKTEGEEQNHVLRKLVDLAYNTGDVELGEKVWPMMPEDMRTSYFWRQQISHLSAKENWDAVCKVLLDQLKVMDQKEDSSVNPAFHAYCAAALRRAGRVKEAQHHDHMADLLCLGDSSMAMQIAIAYAFGDDYERSRVWWERAAHTCQPDAGVFPMAISAYADTMLFEPSQWRLVAALNEVAGCESIESNYYEPEVPLRNMRSRLKADTYRALSGLKYNRRDALALLDKCHQNFVTDGVLADFFFPALRKAGLIEQHDEWFNESWSRFSVVIDQFPESINTINTAAWFASRAQRQLEKAEVQQRKALEIYPEQPAYLDTMAEIQFAKGNRKEALKWSRQAIMMAPADTELRRQYQHFRLDPMPN